MYIFTNHYHISFVLEYILLLCFSASLGKSCIITLTLAGFLKVHKDHHCVQLISVQSGHGVLPYLYPFNMFNRIGYFFFQLYLPSERK